MSVTERGGMIQDIVVSVLGWAPLFIILCLLVFAAQLMNSGTLKKSEARMEESIRDQKEVLAVLKEIKELLKKGQA
jgi:Na+-transporting methylmalonyl-CoA/oxaloacetate decarboxylase gamma subunit